MNDEIPPETMNEIIDLILDDQKIEAVKRYKLLRGISLREAKTFIEELTVRLKENPPTALPASSELDEIQQLIFAGQKLKAIKGYRELRSTSLIEAKQQVEQLTDDLRQKFPEKFSARSTTGCTVKLALLAIILSVGWIFSADARTTDERHTSDVTRTFAFPE